MWGHGVDEQNLDKPFLATIGIETKLLVLA